LPALLSVADKIRALSPFDHDVWANLEAYTEAAWTRRALAGDWPPDLAAMQPRHDDQGLNLVCRPNLDVYTGMAGLYRERHGSLRGDGGHAVLARALEQGGRSTDALWFDLDRVPHAAELGGRYGDTAGQGVHFTETSVRYLWLDRAQRARLTRRR
jgi:hypothetical protein